MLSTLAAQVNELVEEFGKLNGFFWALGNERLPQMKLAISDQPECATTGRRMPITA